MTDSDRLNWLEENSFSIISNDMGWWCCTVDGMQNVPEELPCDIQTTFFIEKNQWFQSVRQAIDEAIEDSWQHDPEIHKMIAKIADVA